jgi:RNA polymerase sigma-70 factor (ECF subfamily)
LDANPSRVSAASVRAVPANAVGFEHEAVQAYAVRLLALARRELPQRLQRRVDAEDIVQSVYRSFFRRLQEGQFNFGDAHDIWRLLVVMTYHKVKNLIKYHQRGRRDVRREKEHDTDVPHAESADPVPGPEDLTILWDCLNELLAPLPDKYRSIVTMRLEGRSIAEIAGTVQYSQRTVLRVLEKVEASARAG